jgi:3-phenylpropionate/trans-cinnamate dioxygenase ferredoxin subunit
MTNYSLIRHSLITASISNEKLRSRAGEFIKTMSEFIKVAKISDLAPGEKMLVEYDDEDVGLFNLDGEFYAISDVCTHDGGPLVEGHLDGDCIVCPRHGARFNIKTGEQTMPAFAPVPLYQVKIEGDNILIAPQD